MSSRRNTTTATQLDKRIQKLIERKDKDNEEMNVIRRKKLRERSEADKERLEVLIARRTGLLDKIDELKERRGNKQTERAKAEREVGKAKAKTPKETPTIVDKDKKIRQEINDNLKELSRLRRKGKSRTEADNKELEQLTEKRGKLLKEEKKEIAKKPQKEQSKKSFEERKEERRNNRGLTSQEAQEKKLKGLAPLLNKFIPLLNNTTALITEFGKTSQSDIKKLLRFFRNDKLANRYAKIIDAFNVAFQNVNVDDTTFRTFMGENQDFKKGMENFVPFVIAKDFKPKQGSIQELVGEERVANLLQEFSIDKQSLLNYLQDVDIDVRKQETEGQVGGGFPQGFSVEEQVFNSLQNYTRRSGLVAGTFESMNLIDPATEAEILKKKPPLTGFTFPNREGTKSRIYQANDALKGQIPIQQRQRSINAPSGQPIYQIDKDAPIVFTKGLETMRYDPSRFTGGYSSSIPGITVAEIKKVGSKDYIIAHQAGIGKDVNEIKPGLRTQQEMRFKSAIDPLQLPIDPNSGRFKTTPLKYQEDLGLTREPFFQKGIEVPKVSASGSLSYEFKSSERQFDPRIEVLPAEKAQVGKDRYGVSREAELTAEKRPRSEFPPPKLKKTTFGLNLATVPGFPIVGATGGYVGSSSFVVPDEAVFKYTPAPIDPQRLKTQKTIYPTVQQSIKFKGGFNPVQA